MGKQISRLTKEEFEKLLNEHEESAEAYISRIGGRKKKSAYQEEMDELLRF